MYHVLARKWRPQTFEELVGQPHVAKTLTNAIRADRLAHAYLFAGVRGTGKTSAARILAKCLNCEKGPAATPCGECASCKEIAEGQSMDVMEIDAASRTKVEQTRELLDMISYAPVRDRHKILIIDEVHMLSKHSFNALLKTIEEPPPSVVFVLATTELQKVLPTILSRCQVFEFRRVAAREAAAHLRRICDSEGIEIADASLERIARAGEGSIRDSLTVLERVVAFCGEQVDDEDVLRILDSVRNDVLAAMIAGFARRDAAATLTVLDGLAEEGHDLVHFWSELIGALRDLLLLRVSPDRPELLARSAEEAAVLADAAKGLSREDLSRIFQILADLETRLKSSSQPRFLFEAALIRLASLGAVRPIEDVLAELGRGGDRPAGPPGASGKASRASGGRKAAPPARPARPTSGGDATTTARAAPSAGDVAGRFRAAVERAKPMLAAMLDEAREIEIEGRTLVIAFPAEHEPLRRQLERKDNRRTLAACAAEVAGGDLDVRVSTAGAPGDAPSAAAPAARRRGSSAPPEAGRAPAAADLAGEARREPGVRKLLREFGAQVIEVRPSGAAGAKRPRAAKTFKEMP